MTGVFGKIEAMLDNVDKIIDSQELYEAIFKYKPWSVAVVDENRTIVLVNEKFEGMGIANIGDCIDKVMAKEFRGFDKHGKRQMHVTLNNGVNAYAMSYDIVTHDKTFRVWYLIDEDNDVFRQYKV